jgi:hypothetical protein
MSRTPPHVRWRTVPLLVLASITLAACGDDDPAAPATAGGAGTSTEPELRQLARDYVQRLQGNKNVCELLTPAAQQQLADAATAADSSLSDRISCEDAAGAIADAAAPLRDRYTAAADATSNAPVSVRENEAEIRLPEGFGVLVFSRTADGWRLSDIGTATD